MINNFSAIWRFSPAPGTLWTLVGGGLIAITAAIAVTRLHPSLRNQPRVQQAVQSWLPVILIAALTVLLGPALTWVTCMLTSLALLREGMRLLPLPTAHRRLHGVLAGLLSVVAHALAAAGQGPLALVLCLIYTSLLLAPVHMLTAGPAQFLARVGGLILVINACLTLFLFVCLLVLQAPAGRPYGGPGQGCFFFVLIIFSDGMQYVGGKLWGRHALAPSISPGKTWEGVAFAAGVCAALGAALGPSLLALPTWACVLLAFSMVVLGLIGDLLVSCWKRDIGVKDTGSVLPGQGGVLDRCDSMIFVAPWFWALMQVTA
ncbi:phosphatidate cytidylyltransferase [Roseateles cellulosilyticus]|uniref:Phosphatidate cytidylyltransferase n=1 Tax=Pelomonas cellulosilytica TaxID=2906762 RepID=A0ABS8XNF2_9BURK|nr:phosphatidate cytidylyltransferase [Pelomonas sp. P8]MCE4554306.1 phosphatidate cytidylyltransferase [Pelomonas sp. P8]